MEGGRGGHLPESPRHGGPGGRGRGAEVTPGLPGGATCCWTQAGGGGGRLVEEMIVLPEECTIEMLRQRVDGRIDGRLMEGQCTMVGHLAVSEKG